MKIILSTLALLLSFLCQSQRTDVMIIGTIHHYQKQFQSLQDFEGVANDIINFEPDIICIESIPVDDSLSLNEIWPNTTKKADSLKVKLKSGAYDSLSTSLQLKAANLWSDYDFWNAYYYWDPLKEGQSPGPFSSYHRNLSNSEYGLFIFPAARTLGVTSFENIDFRDGEKEFLEKQNKALRQSLFRLKLKPLRTYLKLQRKYKKAEEEGQIMSFINGPEFQDSFGDLIEQLPKNLKKSEEAQFVRDYWHHRNKMMAERIHGAAMKTEARKILVTVGSAHVGHIKLYLEKLGHTVTTYGEVLSQKSKGE